LNPSSRFAFSGNSGLPILWEDGERLFCRGNSFGNDATPVLAVFPAIEHPALGVLDRLAHEYELRDELDAAWAAKPLEFVREQRRAVLLLQDPGGEPLGRLIGPPMGLEVFLRLAVALSVALSRLHGRGLVHKDIKPTNVLVNALADKVWLTGFGIASRFPSERQSSTLPEFPEGTLAYMAPEQTGRTNSSIDSRSDLYSLGVTLYQMLTGSLPFTASNPMEWIHSHIAKNPISPGERLMNVPAPVSAIIMKLLAKAAQDRYQTAAGLEHDLRRCLSEARGQIDAFPLGERDIPDRPVIHRRELPENVPVTGPTSTIAAGIEHLDLATVVQVSRALSGEIVQERLLETLMRVVIEQSGAQRGLLVLSREAALRIVVEAKSSDTITVWLGEEPVNATALPESIVHHVLRTREMVIFDHSTAQSVFAADPYIHLKKVRSVLCVPLLDQGQAGGVLYLENSLIDRAFSPERIAVLELIAAQAAISLEKTRLYRELAKREEKNRRLVDSNIMGIYLWDFEGRFIEVNDEFLRMVGYDREDLLTGSIRRTDLTPPEWRDGSDARTRQEKSSARFELFEKEYTRKDGSRVPVLIREAKFEQGGSEGVAFVLDLTDRKRADEALRESEAKFRDYAETTSDWLWEIGPNYKFTMLTKNAFGSDPAQRIGTTCWDHALDVETEPEKWRLVWVALDAHESFRDFVYCAVDRSGAPMYVKVSGKPVFHSSGKFLGYRGTGTDVTAIVRGQRAEASLQTVQAELAHVSRVMTLGQLAASIAHEVNQPIGSALNNARAALNFLDRSHPDLDEVREALGCIVADADRAGGIIDRIRDQIKKVPPRSDPFDLNRALEEVIGLAQGMMTENGVSVQSRLASGMAPVLGDRVQLQQVVLNLILNAVEAMRSVEADERQLLISTDQGEANCTLVAVRDSGPGIDPKHLEHIFEAFYSTKSGMGMGLSICRSIIAAHGGRLWATATEPRGALFQFTLPNAKSSITRPFTVRESGKKTSL
jgi:PAS domain S-box-containing protein